MELRSVPGVQRIATALTLAALVTTGAACSSSNSKTSSKPSDSTAAKSEDTGSTTPQTDAQNVGSASDSDSPNPCEIVTAAEVRTILGAAATPKGPENKNRGSVCTWNEGNGGSVLVQVFHGKEFYSPEMQAPKATKLAGVGDEAYLDAFGSTRVSVGFLKGDTAVFVDGMFGVTSSDAVVAAAKDAASKV
jgi:hypothetical protein